MGIDPFAEKHRENALSVTLGQAYRDFHQARVRALKTRVHTWKITNA